MSPRRRAETRNLLGARDWHELGERARADRSLLRALLSLTFDGDELIGWRAVEAVGRVAGVVAESDPERVRGFLRRLLWSMNDESGGVGWHAPETIGEILVNVAPLIAEYGVLLTGFYRQSPFERGAHLAVYRVASIARAPFVESVPELAQSLTDSDPVVRGYAALALGAIGGQDRLGAVKMLRDDPHPITLYDFETSVLRETSVGRMAAQATEMLEASGRI